MGRARLPLIVVLLFGGASVAHAHPAVDEGRALYEAGDLLPAIEAFARAEARDDLTLADVEQLFETRALVYRILGDEDAVRTELVRLASIAPDHRFSSDVPPELQEEFAATRGRSRGRLALRVDARPAPTGLTLVARVENDPATLVRSVSMYVQAGDGAFRRLDGDEHVVPIGEGDEVRVYATATGPGGAVIATAGSAERPLVRRRDAEGDGGPSAWLWVGIGAGIVAIGVAVLVGVLVATSGGDNTQPSFPMEML